MRDKLALAGLLFLTTCIAGEVSAESRPPAPDNLNIRIIGTASFQGRQTALIEDSNTLTGAFYKVGDPLYGHKIAAITSDGIHLDKDGKKYFVAFQPSSVRASSSASQQKVVVANTYLPGSSAPASAPNFYTDARKATQWDMWTAQTNKPTKATIVADSGGRFAFPIMTSRLKRVSSGFGMRVHPIGGDTRMHKGVDLSARPGTKIFAADGGRVVWSGWRSGYGRCVIIDHNNGYQTLYGHCSRLLTDAGDVIRRGEYIADVGSTGYSTGPHLHFEIQVDGQPINPARFYKNIL
ncbi:MAG: M23 family metallopeptidase [Candidatus Sumerlaeota bacterium]|nr:M23 family metallopeptidase [Candidatus Sumerlaeota bacterium]